MRLRKIYPGDKIVCEIDAEAKLLLKHLAELGYDVSKAVPGDKYTYLVEEQDGKRFVTYVPYPHRETTCWFDALIIPDAVMDAAEMINWFRQQSSNKLYEIFEITNINDIFCRFSTTEIIQKIQAEIAEIQNS